MDYFLYQLRWAITKTHREWVDRDEYWWSAIRMLSSVVIVVLVLRIFGVK